MSEDREELRAALKNKKNRDEGKRLLKALIGCKEGKEVMDLLHAELPDVEIKKRIANMSDMDVINNLHAVEAVERMKRGTQRNQDLVCAASKRWANLTGKKVKDFKMEVAKYGMERPLQQESKVQPNVVMLTAWKSRQQVH